MNELEKAINKAGYVKGNLAKVKGEFLQNWYTGQPGIAKPSKGDVFVTSYFIIVVNVWTDKVLARFDNVPDFLASCDSISDPPTSTWSQGMFDG